MSRWAGPFVGRPVELGFVLLLVVAVALNLLSGLYGGVVVSLVGIVLVLAFVRYTDSGAGDS